MFENHVTVLQGIVAPNAFGFHYLVQPRRVLQFSDSQPDPLTVAKTDFLP